MFLAMVLFPEVQKKAQAELDAIIGSERLPTLSDRRSLPYMEALLKEIHRWHAVSRLGKFFMLSRMCLKPKQVFHTVPLTMTSTMAITSLRGV